MKMKKIMFHMTLTEMKVHFTLSNLIMMVGRKKAFRGIQVQTRYIGHGRQGKVINWAKNLIEWKLDGLGPVDNRPSTD